MDPSFQFYVPTRFFCGEINDFADEFGGDANGIYAKRALVVTGKSSARNGALDDVLCVLQKNGIKAEVFDQVEENPSIENAVKGGEIGRAFGAGLICAIGGGSPLDAAKAVMLLTANPEMTADDLYSQNKPSRRLPVLAVPTTAGTGSEATPYSILTRHDKQTKQSIPHLAYPDKAFLNAGYTAGLPDAVTISTAVDALTHLVEGYLSVKTNPFTDRLAEGGLAVFKRLLPLIMRREFDMGTRRELLVTASVAGMVISTTKTSLPHQMGYALTYHKGIPHGAACGLLLGGYLRLLGRCAFEGSFTDKPHPNEKTSRVLELIGLSDIDELHEALLTLLGVHLTLSEEEIASYTRALMDNPKIFLVFPFGFSHGDIEAIYRQALL